MRKLTTTMKALMLLVAFIWQATGVMGQASDLFISEYIEGSSNNKALEIYNGTGSSVSLNGYFMLKVGNPTGTQTWADADVFPFTTDATIADGDVFVVYNSGAAAEVIAVGDQSSTITYFNGNDPVALVKDVNSNGTYEDGTDVILTAIGDMTGTTWGGELTWVRKSTFDVAETFTLSEWDEYGQDEFSYLGSHTYTGAVTLPEPTNHVTSFAAAEDDASSITVTWADNDGAQAADAFLVKASTGAITPPVDGTEEADGALVLNIAHGVQTATFTGLTAGTAYNFEIYPYTNTGADIDFKTDGTVPTATATTMAGGTLGWYNLQWPGSGTITLGDSYVVYAQAWEAGVTDAAGAGAGIQAWIGYSTEDTNPNTWTNWVEAPYFGDNTSGDNDEFSVDLGAVLPVGQYYYASRFQFNGGDYMYGGFVQDAGGPWDGTTNVSGVLTVKRAAITTPFAETFDADLGNMYTYSVSGATKEWYHSSGAANINGYNSGDLEEDWMIFPAIDLSAKANEFISFDSWYNFGTDDVDNYLKLMYSEDYTGVGDPSSATWTELTYTAPASSSTWTASGNVDLSAINGTEVYLAFKYHYNSGFYRSWSIDNIAIEEAPLLQAPVVENIVATPAYPTSSEAISVSADVTDTDGTVSTVTLNWGTATGTLSNAINMSLTVKGTYVTDTDIPAQAAGTTVYYEIVAVDNDVQTTTTSEMTVNVAVDVADIAALRAGATDGTVYNLTGEAVITYQRATRNQKYIQDATGGILIDDNAGTITTVYNQYDGITGVMGTLSAYNGVLQFIPAADPGAASSTGNTVTAETVLVTDITGDVNAYESELVLLENMTFADAGGTFASGQNYTITDGTNTITFRTNFSESDVIDATIPSGPQNITALVAEYNGTPQVYSRSIADIAAVVSNDPVIFNVAATPASPTSSDAVSVSADVTDADGTIASVTLNWGTSTGSLGTAITMSVSSGDTYVTDTDIPAQADGTTVYYAITAVDNAANTTITNELSYDVVDVTTTQVADIATLRAGATDGTVYELTGEAVITYQRATRNQKYIQDATAGILIDDNAGTITTAYNQYDGITSVTGTLSAYNGVLQFIPTADPGAATSTGNTVTPQVVLATDITGDVDAYESQLITLESMTFADAGGTFASGQNYTITDGTNTITLRTNFSESNILSTTIPSGPQNITALVAEYNGTAQVYARDLADLVSLNPVIANIAIAPTDPSSSDVVTVSADVTNAVGALTSVELNWGTATGTLTNTVVMTAVGDTYSGDIPAQADGTMVYYEIVATNDNAGVTASEEMSYEVIDYLVATQLSITNVSPVSPYVTQMFNVEVTALDVNGDVGLVSEDTEVQINLSTGTGTLAGTVTGTILNGTSSIVVSGLTYDVAETINVNASTVTGMTLTTSPDFEVVVAALPDVPLVFISEYLEGSSNNKAIEIYNGTGAELDLTGFSVQKSSNGDGVWGSEEVLSGTVAAGDVYVIANAGAVAAILDVADITSTVTYFNGNDAVGLFYNGTLIDVFGVPSEDVIWDVAGVTEAAANHTVVRKYPEVIIGNTDWVASAGTDAGNSEWIVNDQDDFTTIGWHEAAPTEPAITNVAINPNSVTSTDAVSVSATVTDPNGTIASVTLNWGTVSGTLDNAITMSVSTGNTYVTDTDIPAQADGTTVYYEIVAVDNDTETTTTEEMMYTVSDPSVVSLPYMNGFDENNLGDMYSYNAIGDQVWTTSSYGNPAPGAYITGYVDPSYFANEDWLITPGLDFSGVTNAYMTFDEAIRYTGSVAENHRVFASTDYTGAGDPSVATWTELAITGRSTADTWSWFSVDPFDLSSYAGETAVYIAFVYTSTTDVAGTWELDNVNVVEGIPSFSPEIANVTLDPAQPSSSDAVTISATITDADGTVATAVIQWGDTFLYGNEINMTKGTDDTWTADSQIPAQQADVVIFYKIIATDNESNQTESEPMTYAVYDPYTGTLPFYEPFHYDLGVMSQVSVVGANEWYWGIYNSDGYATASGYSGGTVANEDWLITPSLDFSAVTTAALNFSEAINLRNYIDVAVDDLHQVFVSTDYVDDVTTATWTELTITGRNPQDNGFTWADVDEVDLSDYAGESSVYVAWKYQSTDTTNSTWEVDNITITGGNGIANATVNNLTIYPNPAQNEVFVTGVENISNVEILSLDGKVVMSEQTNNNRIDVSSVNDGMYIIRVISGNEVYTTRFVKK